MPVDESLIMPPPMPVDESLVMPPAIRDSQRDAQPEMPAIRESQLNPNAVAPEMNESSMMDATLQLDMPTSFLNYEQPSESDNLLP